MTADQGFRGRESFNYPPDFCSEISIKRTGGQGCEVEYVATLVKGEWPSNDHLVTICDNYSSSWDSSMETKVCRHFGGKVAAMSDTEKKVHVYID